MKKLKMAMIGGGVGAFIGKIHREAVRMDGGVEVVAGMFNRDPSQNAEIAERALKYAEDADKAKAEAERAAEEAAKKAREASRQTAPTPHGRLSWRARRRAPTVPTSSPSALPITSTTPSPRHLLRPGST